MGKKYIDLEEAADSLGIKSEELIRFREKGEIRGFADRGTWKFKAEDVDELRRRLQADSSPDVPILADSESDESLGGSSVLVSEEDEVGEQSTTIRNSVHDDDNIAMEGTSDSDVRLILDDSLDDEDSDPEVPLPSLSDSDSDVQLVDDSDTSLDTGSDSDVALVGDDESEDPGSDSDVRLIDDDATVELSSDSDVKLVGDTEQDLTGSDSDVRLAPSGENGSGVVLGGEEEGSSVLSDDSGLSLADDDSGLSLADDDSGLSILDADSGLTLEADDSGISLEADSGIALAAGSSAGTDEMDQTLAMQISASSGDDEDADTALEVPSLEADDDDSEFELQLDDTDLDTTGGSSVLLFDEDEDPDEHAATIVKKSGDAALLDKAEDETFDLTADDDDADAFDLEEDEFGDGEELEVAEDIIGEDDELDELDVFDADDDVFDESLETGESQAEFASPRGPMGRVEAAIEPEWGGWTFAQLLITTGLMALCTMMMFDLVRSMWAWNQPTSFNSLLLETLGGLFS